MTAIAIGKAKHLRDLTSGLAHEVDRMDKAIAHRELWLEKAPDHVLDAYTRTVDNLADRAMARLCAIKEAVLALQEGL